MSYNGSGTFVVNSSGQPVVSATLITAAAFNAFTADVATGLSTAICKDGQTTITANIPFNTFKITGLGDGASLQDAATLKNVQNGTGVYVGTVGGTADAITLTPSPAITAYAAGQTFRFLCSGTSTGAVTVNVSGLGAKDLTRYGVVALTAGALLVDSVLTITYDGTRFRLASAEVPIAGSWTPSLGGNATYTNQVGRYVRFGRLCFITCSLVVNVLGTGSTSAISGLPFTSYSQDGALVTGESASLAVSPVSINPVVTASGTTITIFGRTAGATGTSTLAIFGNSASIQITGVYRIAD